MIGVLSSDQEIQGLIDIISNTLEAFTTALFIAPRPEGHLKLVSYQSLSRNIDLEVVIGPGEGLIGWVHKNGKPINVDQFETDTRRLLFYKTDESIKSFMAVPLSEINGVLAVDSKQKYIFTEKSQKILYQFSLSLIMMVKRLEIARHAQGMAAAIGFLTELEQVFGKSDDGLSIDHALELTRQYAGAEACFLTALVPGEAERYEIVARSCSFEVDLDDLPLRMDSGLTGWIMQNQRPLILERLRTDSERSFIFHPDEPLGKLLGFAGFPVMSGSKLRGALLFGAYDPLGLDKVKAKTLATASSRMAIGLETEALKNRVAELTKLDPQVGLPHKTYFALCLKELLQDKKVRSRGLILAAIQILNLDHLAWAMGQEVSQAVLKAAGRIILYNTPEDSELGHLEYGIIGLTLTGKSETEVWAIAEALSDKLTRRPLANGQDRIRLETKMALANYPVDGQRAEELIQLVLARLEEKLD